MKIVAIIGGIILLAFAIVGMAVLELILIMVFAPNELENDNNITE